MRAIRPFLFLAATAGAVIACSSEAPSEPTANDESELVSDQASQVFSALSFLDGSLDPEPVTGPEADAELAKLDESIPPSIEISGWAGVPTIGAQSVRVPLKDGRFATLTSRRFSDVPADEAERARIIATITRVVGPDGNVFSYAERLRLRPSVHAELYKVENRRLVTVIRQSSALESLTGGLDRANGGIDIAALQVQLGIEPQALSRKWRGRLCTTCTMTLQAAKFVGPAILAIAGTGGASAVCTKLGITAAAGTAATGPGAILAGGGAWIACNLAFYVVGALISSAMLIDGEDARKERCSGYSDAVGLGRVCEGLAPDECSVATVSQARTPAAKCSLMGRCARAFHCKFSGNQLCPSLDVTGQSRAMCQEIAELTCAQPIGLVDVADFNAPCDFLAKKHATPPTPPSQ